MELYYRTQKCILISIGVIEEVDRILHACPMPAVVRSSMIETQLRLIDGV